MIHSAGYDGSVDEPEWSDLLAMSGGRQYGVADAASWRATPGTGDRQINLSTGRGFGYGVRDLTDAEETLTLDPIASGSRWDLVAMRRDWGTNQSAFHVVKGGTAKELPARAVTVAVLDDQPLWLARVQAGFSQVRELVDLRVWGGDGGALAADPLVLQFLNRLGTVVQIGDVEWSRVFDSLGSPIWRRRDVTEDTGWVDIARNGGWEWAYGQVRRIGGIVFYRAVAGRSAGWAPGNAFGTVPAGLRPSVDHYAISSHSNGEGAEFQFKPDGGIVASKNSNGDTNVTINGSYPAAV
ncbi:MAG: hypothetical protein K0S70_2358 [Microbacterium sp.]|jgi:hypothetical protein|nr:hypothetical protein [Microbacterium sp.]